MSKQEYWYSSRGLPKICTLAGCMLMGEKGEGWRGGGRIGLCSRIRLSAPVVRSPAPPSRDTLPRSYTFPALSPPGLDLPYQVFTPPLLLRLLAESWRKSNDPLPFDRNRVDFVKICEVGNAKTSRFEDGFLGILAWNLVLEVEGVFPDFTARLELN